MSYPCETSSNHALSEAKRRRLRKGTHSCWECKRRKMKCIFDPLTDANTCNGCRRRGYQCVSQEFPEDISLSASIDKTGESRTYDERTPTRTPPNEDGKRAANGIPTPASMTAEPSQYLAFYKSSKNDIHQATNHTPTSQGKHARLSRFLHESLPSREDTERICRASHHPTVLPCELITMPYVAGTLNQNALATPETLLEIPGPKTHPVLIARHMLLLATFIQQLHPTIHKEIQGLSEPPRVIRERLVDLAINLVTTNDELLGSIEGIECLMIECVYQANLGNLRRGWVSNRRAMTITQLMGLNRVDNQPQCEVLDPKTKYSPSYMWFRIVFLDRYLCLLLGVSQGSLDRSMASDALLASDNPTGRLERIHCVVASRILERNESRSSSSDIASRQLLDLELQRAARSLPSKWWLVPNLDVDLSDSHAMFWNTRRLFAQLLHYNLLNQLHLPYVFRSSSTKHEYEYSRVTCVNASREILSRFITLRSFNGIACSCRTIDFLALMAAMTLLLVYIDGQRSEGENLLAHQYQSDRAMIEQVQENMEEVNCFNSDALSAQSANLLRRLLAIDLGTADPRRARKVSVQEAGAEMASPNHDDDAAVSVQIPYFGTIKITLDNMSMEVPRSQASTTANRSPQSQSLDSSSTVSPGTTDAEPQMNSSRLGGPCGVPNVDAMTNAIYGSLSVMPDTCSRTRAQLGAFQTSANDVAPSFTMQNFCDPFSHQGEYPGLAAGTEDWAFQGVDLAFFDSLMRSSGNERNERREGNEGNEGGGGNQGVL